MACILVVDDDPEVREIVESMLLSAGHEVVLAADGDDGVRKFREQPVDLIVCDAIMPKKDGFEAIREIRSLSADVPIVSMTGSFPRPSGGAHLDPNYLRMSQQFGATKVIAKPFRAPELLALVRQCLDSSPRDARRQRLRGLK